MKLAPRVVRQLLLHSLKMLPLVDKNFYLSRYPDVAELGIDPTQHFARYGFFEGRSANAMHERWKKSLRAALARVIGFDCQYYLAENQDVAAAGVDPLAHFLKHGMAEGRRPRAPKVDRAALQLLLASFVSACTGRPTSAGSRSQTLGGLAKRGAKRALAAAVLIERIIARRHGQQTLIRHLPLAEVSTHSPPWIHVEHVEAASEYTFQEPEIIGEPAARPHRTVTVPAKWIATVCDAVVIGGYQVIANDHLIVYEPAAAPHSNFVAGAWRYVTGVTGDRSAICHYDYTCRVELREGILLSGRCSPNYYHWLIEYLARLYALRHRAHLREVPLIVDADMYPQEFESLALIAPGWPVYKLAPNTLLRVGKLHIPSIPTYLPDSVDIPFWQGSALCHATLNFLRDAAYQRYGIGRTPPTRKIFLTRRGARTIVGMNEIEQALERIGFECIDSGQLGFEAQVKLFSECTMIVGPLGAAFTNLIFCQPGCKVLGLASPYVKRFCLQANLARFAGCEYKILAGEHPSYQPGDEHRMSDVVTMHADFSISPQALVAAIEAWH
jgi:capsular polysaccharide biosynthesis protein